MPSFLVKIFSVAFITALVHCNIGKTEKKRAPSNQLGTAKNLKRYLTFTYLTHNTIETNLHTTNSTIYEKNTTLLSSRSAIFGDVPVLFREGEVIIISYEILIRHHYPKTTRTGNGFTSGQNRRPVTTLNFTLNLIHISYKGKLIFFSFVMYKSVSKNTQALHNDDLFFRF